MVNSGQENGFGWILTLGALVLFVGVAAGAFGAHGLKNVLSEYSRGVYEKAVFYHLVHGLAILLVAILASSSAYSDSSLPRLIAYCLTGGVVLFSGSLYLLAITEVKWLGAITPLGGTLFLLAWGLLAYLPFSVGAD